MKVKTILTSLILLSLSAGTVAGEVGDKKKLTDDILRNWPYHAFLAIPRISEFNTLVSIEIVQEEEEEEVSTNCLNIDYFELRKKYKPDTVLDRESLHRLLCKAVKRAINRTPFSEIKDFFLNNEVVGLKFDFENGQIEFAEIPYPPKDPYSLLEDFFVYEDDEVLFGDIEFPREVESEIKETKL